MYSPQVTSRTPATELEGTSATPQYVTVQMFQLCLTPYDLFGVFLVSSLTSLFLAHFTDEETEADVLKLTQ